MATDRTTTTTDLYDILVIDDERSTAVAIMRLCCTHYNIDAADSAEIALDILRERQFKVVLCDYKLPGMSGITLLALVQIMQPRAVRVLISGTSDEAVAEEAQSIGRVFHFVHKPFDPDELLEILRRATTAYDTTVADATDRSLYTVPL